MSQGGRGTSTTARKTERSVDFTETESIAVPIPVTAPTNGHEYPPSQGNPYTTQLSVPCIVTRSKTRLTHNYDYQSVPGGTIITSTPTGVTPTSNPNPGGTNDNYSCVTATKEYVID